MHSKNKFSVSMKTSDFYAFEDIMNDDYHMYPPDDYDFVEQSDGFGELLIYVDNRDVGEEVLATAKHFIAEQERASIEREVATRKYCSDDISIVIQAIVNAMIRMGYEHLERPTKKQRVIESRGMDYYERIKSRIDKSEDAVFFLGTGEAVIFDVSLGESNIKVSLSPCDIDIVTGDIEYGEFEKISVSTYSEIYEVVAEELFKVGVK